jgi:pimeloyl-ACP methyl ester carboxylesterase
MSNNTITINGLQLAAYEYHPEKENSIVFIHGNSTSSNTWRKQVTSNLLKDYRLLCIDLPNHGHSDAIPSTGNFSLPAIAKIMSAALKQLMAGKPSIICSVSLATNIVAEMMAMDLRVKGLIMAGPCIVGEGYGMDKMILPGADATAVFAENLPHEIVTTYAGEASLSRDTNDRNIFLKDYHAVKGNFRSSLYATIAAGTYSDEVALLQQSKSTTCIVFGEDEKIVNRHYLDEAPLNLWNKTIYTIPCASHLVNIDAPEAFNKLVAAFAKDMFTTSGS